MISRRRKRLHNRLREMFGADRAHTEDYYNSMVMLDDIRRYYEEVSSTWSKADRSKTTVAVKNREKQTDYRDYVDEITWNDLEMDELFLRMNHTKSYVGEQQLYLRLHELNTHRDWEKLEEQIAYVTDHEQERLHIEEKLAAIGKRQEDYRLIDFLFHAREWKVESGWLYRLLQLLLVVLLLAALITDSMACVGGLVAVALLNLSIYVITKQRYEVFLYSLGSIRQLVAFGRTIVANPQWKQMFGTEGVAEAVQELRKLERMIAGFQNRKNMSMAGDLAAIVQDYLLGITLYELSSFNHIMRIISGKQDEVLRLYECAGQIDMIIALASYRASQKKWCQPQFATEQQPTAEQQQTTKPHRITAVNLYHPLLTAPVTNDFTMENHSLITGANASGKSTFMKSLAINAILAQTVHTCTADAFSLPPIGVMTSMALRDDLLTGESYYIREVRYLKRMLDRIGEHRPVLCVIDEILKGTNTRERLAASEAVLDHLSDKECLVLVATHDMELVEKLKGQYNCYYFESQIQEDDIQFDYHIHSGVGGESNAIQLLACMNYPEELVKRARQLASS